MAESSIFALLCIAAMSAIFFVIPSTANKVLDIPERLMAAIIYGVATTSLVFFVLTVIGVRL